MAEGKATVLSLAHLNIHYLIIFVAFLASGPVVKVLTR